MDLMYTRNFDGVCLVSSDSDCTRLAQRLREEGLTVYGFGERNTPDAFVQACDKFIYTEVLRPETETGRASDEQGWAHPGAVGTDLNKVRPDFDPRLYGQKKLSDLLRQHPRHFKVEERGAPNSAGKSLYVRIAGWSQRVAGVADAACARVRACVASCGRWASWLRRRRSARGRPARFPRAGSRRVRAASRQRRPR